MNKKKRLNSPLGLGIPMILCIFMVLLMSVLSLMTYLKSLTIKETVEREIEYASAYYRADIKAKNRLSENKEDQEFEIPLENGLFLKVKRENGNISEYYTAGGEE